MRERFDLAREDVIVAVVVADARKRRRVYRERFAVQAGPLAKIAPRKLGGHVLRFGGAAAVAAPQNLLAVAQRLHERIDDCLDLSAIVRSVEQSSALGEQFVEAAATVTPWASRLDPKELLALRNELAVVGHDAHDRSGVVALDFVEKLHRFEHAENVAGFDAIADLDERRNVGRRRAIEDAGERRDDFVTLASADRCRRRGIGASLRRGGRNRSPSGGDARARRRRRRA